MLWKEIRSDYHKSWRPDDLTLDDRGVDLDNSGKDIAHLDGMATMFKIAYTRLYQPIKYVVWKF